MINKIKFKKSILAIALVSLMGCNYSVKVPNDKIALKVYGSDGVDYSEKFSGNTLIVSDNCVNKCTGVITIPRNTFKYIEDGSFYVDKSQFDMGLGVTVLARLKTDTDSIRKAVNLYKSEPGLRPDLDRVITQQQIIDISVSPFTKGAIRSAINDNKLSIEDVLSNQDEIAHAILKKLRTSTTNFPVEIVAVRISRVAQPEIIKEKKEKLKAMQTEQEITKRKLQMQLDIERKKQAVRVVKAKNDVKIQKIIQKGLSLSSYDYQFLQVLSDCANNTTGNCNIIVGGDGKVSVRSK